MLVLGDRQIAEPRDQRAAERDLRAADQHHPPRKGDRLVRGGVARRLHRPSLQRSRRAAMKAAIGKQRTPTRIDGPALASKGTGAPSRPATRHWAISDRAMKHRGDRPFDPIVAPHRAAVEDVHGDHDRRPQRDRKPDRIADDEVIGEAERGRPPGRPGIGAKQPPADQHQQAEVGPPARSPRRSAASDSSEPTTTVAAGT